MVSSNLRVTITLYNVLNQLMGFNKSSREHMKLQILSPILLIKQQYSWHSRWRAVYGFNTGAVGSNPAQDIDFCLRLVYGDR